MKKKTVHQKTNPKEKKWYVYLQGSANNAGTEFEKGTVQIGKLGFEYRILLFGFSWTWLEITNLT